MRNAVQQPKVSWLWFAAVMLWLCCQSTWSMDYYISDQGSDAADGLAAQANSALSSTGPFATFAPLMKLSLRDSNRIFLACGQRFQGPLQLSLQGSAATNLAINGFGTCNPGQRPVIDGRLPAELLNGTGLKTIKQEKPVVQVFSGNTPILRARFPKEGYLIFTPETVSAFDRIPAHLSLNGKDVAGSVLHARTQEWFIEEKIVNGVGGLLDSPLQYPLRPKAGAYLTGKAWMIGEEDGWAYDQSRRSLTVRNTKAQPVSLVSAGPLLQITGKGSVSIRGIAFDAAGGDAISLKLDSTAIISDVVIMRAAGNGISIAGASYAEVTNSRVQDVRLDAIFFAEVARVMVSHNKIVNAGLYLGPAPSLAAINAHRTQAATIDQNEVSGSSYIGIRFSGDAKIRRNFIKGSCRYMSDCSAIYTWRQNVEDRRPPVEVAGNLIVDVRGDTSVKFGVTDYFSGIYLDEFTRNVNVKNNVIFDASQGIYLHNAVQNIVEQNIIGGTDQPLLVSIVSGNFPDGELLFNSIKNNEIFTKKVVWSFVKQKPVSDQITRDTLMEIRLKVTSEKNNGANELVLGCNSVKNAFLSNNEDPTRSLAFVRRCK